MSITLCQQVAILGTVFKKINLCPNLEAIQDTQNSRNLTCLLQEFSIVYKNKIYIDLSFIHIKIPKSLSLFQITL